MVWWKSRGAHSGRAVFGEELEGVRTQGLIGAVVKGQGGADLQQGGPKAPVQPQEALVLHDCPQRMGDAGVVVAGGLSREPGAHQIQRVRLHTLRF